MRTKRSLEAIFAQWDEFQKVSGVCHIETARDYDKVVGLTDALVDAGAMASQHSQHSLYMVLADLIYAYDQQHFPQAKVHGIDLLRFLMEQDGLTQSQLPEIGTQSVVSEILAGKRELTTGHIRALAKRFALSPAAFF
ncbi:MULTISPECIES: helix-turn-helix domain-containing protein [Luteibacter]|uniref:helix-turn-helix domain-containing protein n=1 Tax=Luteibacter sp. dw_328 TaxID=2719796 RepID=UPI0007BFC5A1|nr:MULTISPECIES: helix-turn-helix domain-containing protein [Luteibacter]